MGNSANWSLAVGGDLRKFDDWGFSGLRRRLVNLAEDVVQFVHPVSSAAADPLLPVDSPVTIYRPDGTQWFSGVVTHTDFLASGGQQSHRYQITGPWYSFTQLMQVAWPYALTEQPALQYNTHLILNLNTNGTHATASSVINAVLTRLIATGANFQVGNILPAADETFYPPISEVRDRTCAEVIRDQLRWAPNAVAWFDYSTVPPTLHIREPDHLTAITLPYDGSETAAGTDLTPRYDLQFSEVLLKFESIQTVNGTQYIGWSYDAWPADAVGDKLDSYVQTIDLRGPSFSQTVVQVSTRPIAGSDSDWWKTKLPILDNSAITDLSVNYVGRSGENSYPNELVEGSLDDWMNFNSEQDTVQAELTYKENGEQRTDVLFEVPVTATNASSGTYRSPVSVTSGDPKPVGLAKWLYDQINPLQWEGQHTLIEKVCSGSVGLGNMVNFSGGHPDWATINGIIQRVDEDVDLGRTTVYFGPRAHLGPTDVIEYLRGR